MLNQKIGRSGQILLRSVLALGSIVSFLCWHAVRHIPSSLIALIAVQPNPGIRNPYHKPLVHNKKVSARHQSAERSIEAGYTLNEFDNFARYHCSIQGLTARDGQPKPGLLVRITLETNRNRQVQIVHTDDHGHYEAGMAFNAAVDEPIHWRIEAGADSSEKGEAEGQLIALADQTTLTLDVPVRLEIDNSNIDMPQALSEKINTQVQ